MTFAKNLKFVRSVLRQKQHEFAITIDISLSLVKSLEIQNSLPTSKALVSISKTLDLNPIELWEEDIEAKYSKEEILIKYSNKAKNDLKALSKK